MLSTISLFCFSVSIKYFWKVHAVLMRGKVKWQVAWCLLGSCPKHICTNSELGLLKGHWTWGILSAGVFLVKRAKRLSYLGSEFPQSAHILRNSLPVLQGVQLGYFSFVFHRGLWFERGFSWFPASCIVKKICNLNRHKAFCYSDAWARIKISVRLAFTSAYVSLETDISRGLMLAIAYTPKACFLSPLP